MAGATHGLVQRFVEARRDPGQAVLEGYHAIKHALRFGADPTQVVAIEGTHAADLPVELTRRGLAPTFVEETVFDRLVPSRPPVPVVALAPRPPVDAEGLLRGGGAPVVLLERPTHAGNVGAAVRVAAAAGADGLVVIDGADPWSPAALRGGAGLQFALPVAAIDALPATGGRPLVVFDPAGRDMRELEPPEGAVLAFGTERRGVSGRLLDRADEAVAIPMRERVSSLNLATSVAVGLYAFATPRVD